MGQWKIGYVTGLSNMGTYTQGMEAYHPFGAKTLILDSTKMCRAVGTVSTAYYNGIGCDNIVNYPNNANNEGSTSFESDEYTNGFMRILSGGGKSNVYKIIDTTSSGLYFDNNAMEVVTGNRFEVVTGPCTFVFPEGRNPTRQDFKRLVMNRAIRYPYYGGGLVIPTGWQPDDFMITSVLTDVRDADRLEIMLNHILDYKGFDGLYSIGKLNSNPNGFAPMILETGSQYAQFQHLVNVVDYDIKKDAKKSDDFFNISIHLEGYNVPIYRGV